METQASRDPERGTGPAVYTRYPLRSVVLYNGTTIVHFCLAAAGIVVAFSRWPVGAWLLGAAYFAFAFANMYLVMPLKVCSHCVYRTMADARCVSGLNLVVGRFSRPRSREAFVERAEGFFCHNNLYMASLIAPLALMALGLFVNFSPALLAILLLVAGLMAFRYFVLFKRVACPHCAAKGRCPNAKAMGIA